MVRMELDGELKKLAIRQLFQVRPVSVLEISQKADYALFLLGEKL